MTRASSFIVSYGDTLIAAALEGGRSPRVRSVHHLDATADESLADRVERAARTLTDLGRRTFVLSDEVFAVDLEFEGRALRGLSDDDLVDALALEAQMHSGISAADARISWRRAPGAGSTRGFHVQQISQAEIDDVEDRLHELGGRLLGVAHPAGLPRPLASVGEDGFVRNERWPGVTVRVDGRGPEPHVSLVRDRATAGGAAGPVATEALHATPSPTANGAPPDATFTLADPETLNRWLESWASVLIESKAGAGIGPTPRPPSVARRVAVAVALAAVCVAVALWDRDRLNDRRQVAATELRALRAPIDEATQLRTEISRLRRELDELTASAAGPAASRSAWTSGLPAHLLDAVADCRPSGVMVESLGIDWRGGQVEGSSIALDGVDRFSRALSDRLAPHGVHLVPRRRRLVDDGPRIGLYEFVLDLRIPDLPAEPSSAAATAPDPRGEEEW